MNLYLVGKRLQFLFKAKHWRGFGIHGAFGHSFINDVLRQQHPFYFFAPLNYLRKQLLKDYSVVKSSRFGAGSKVSDGDTRRVCDLVRWSSASSSKGELLSYLANWVKAETILELGTCMGLSTIYLALADRRAKVYTIEASSDYLTKAKLHLNWMKVNNVEAICGSFEDVLPNLMATVERFDLVYIDGNHQEEATVAYFKQVLSSCHDTSVIIFDDIYWSKGMTNAWKRIVADEAVTLSFDLFDLGIVFLKKTLQKEHFLVRRHLFY